VEDSAHTARDASCDMQHRWALRGGMGQVPNPPPTVRHNSTLRLMQRNKPSFVCTITTSFLRSTVMAAETVRKQSFEWGGGGSTGTSVRTGSRSHHWGESSASASAHQDHGISKHFFCSDTPSTYFQWASTTFRRTTAASQSAT
jgi:hypothetical protein